MITAFASDSALPISIEHSVFPNELNPWSSMKIPFHLILPYKDVTEEHDVKFQAMGEESCENSSLYALDETKLGNFEGFVVLVCIASSNSHFSRMNFVTCHCLLHVNVEFYKKSLQALNPFAEEHIPEYFEILAKSELPYIILPANQLITTPKIPFNPYEAMCRFVTEEQADRSLVALQEAMSQDVSTFTRNSEDIKTLAQEFLHLCILEERQCQEDVLAKIQLNTAMCLVGRKEHAVFVEMRVSGILDNYPSINIGDIIRIRSPAVKFEVIGVVTSRLTKLDHNKQPLLWGVRFQLPLNMEPIINAKEKVVLFKHSAQKFLRMENALKGWHALPHLILPTERVCQNHSHLYFPFVKFIRFPLFLNVS